MKRFLKYFVVLILLCGVSLFAYDYYMRNSGLKNRVDYEIQKDEIKNDRPVRNFFRKLFD